MSSAHDDHRTLVPHVAVVGAGTMGRGIAQLALQAGCPVVLIDADAAALERAVGSLKELFGALAAKGRLHSTPAELLSRLDTARDVAAAATATWVIEAVPEVLELKRSVFGRLAVVAPGARLATNTSTLSVTAIASGCSRPEDVIGLHFFNPPGLMRLVEVVPGVTTRRTLVDEAVAFARLLGREPVVASDSPGFIVNRVARPYYLEALRLHAAGVPVETCDAAMRAVGFPMGPFELLDLIGLDVNLASSISVFTAFFEEPRYRPHPLQQRMVDAGWLGRKAGRGFYRYDERGARLGAEPVPVPAPPQPDAVSTFAIIGEDLVASLLRSRLPAPAEGEHADFTFDTRSEVADVAGTSYPSDVVAVLAWGRSASSAHGAAGPHATTGSSHHPTVLGFSLLPGVTTSDEKLAIELLVPATPAASLAARALGAALTRAGVTVVTLPDQPGGIAFRIVALLINEAVSALAEGLAEPAAIDMALRLGVNYPLGPLEWAERLGPAAVLAALDSLHREIGAERFAPHPLLRAMVALGHGSFSALGALQRAPAALLSGTMGR
jgi:3-hydroxybutyryl-CoA dehydrogenase